MASPFTAVVIDSDDSSRNALITQLKSTPGVSVEADAPDLALGMKLARQIRPSTSSSITRNVGAPESSPPDLIPNSSPVRASWPVARNAVMAAIATCGSAASN